MTRTTRFITLTAIGFFASSTLAHSVNGPASTPTPETISSIKTVAFGKSQARALDRLLSQKMSPKGFRFCGVDKKTNTCKGKSGIRGAGLGGTVLPLVLNVKSFDILDRSKAGNTWTLATKFKASVNGIPPACAKTTGTVSLSAKKPGQLNYKTFYCNWLGIGNVVTKVKLNIETVDLKTRSFSGKYTVRFNGTGNVFGAGLFKAFAR